MLHKLYAQILTKQLKLRLIKITIPPVTVATSEWKRFIKSGKK